MTYEWNVYGIEIDSSVRKSKAGCDRIRVNAENDSFNIFLCASYYKYNIISIDYGFIDL
jgi:hypothetical protein